MNEVEWDYNGFNQVVAEYQEHDGAVNKATSAKVCYSYASGAGNTIRPTGMSYPGGSENGYGYEGEQADALSRVSTMTGGSVVLGTWSYVGLGMIATQKYPAASATELSYGNSADGYGGYDRFGRIVGTKWSKGSRVQVESSYGRNAVGNIAWRQSQGDGQDSYTWYDGLRQVRSQARGTLTPSGGPPYTGIGDAQQQETFAYDETGNWKAVENTQGSLSQTREHDTGNEITAISNPSAVVQPVYDAAGNMTTLPAPSDWTSAYTAKWDAWNRLVELKEGTRVVGSYAYDARTRRIRKTTESETRDYYYDQQWRVIEERVEGAVAADYAWSPFDRWNLIRRRRTVNETLDESLYVLRDNLDPVAIVDTAGTVVERYAYDAFGTLHIFDACFESLSESSYDWNFLFHGEFIDSESGLYNYGYRYYHPQLGRWLSRDPIGEQGGINLFAFVSNDPTGVRLSEGRVFGRCF